MNISITNENNILYQQNKNIKVKIITEKNIEKHKKIKVLGISLSLKNNKAPDSLKNCRLNKSLKDKFDNILYWIGKIGRQLIPNKKLKSFFAERKY